MSNKKKVSSVKKTATKKNSKPDKKAGKKLVAKNASAKPAAKKNSAKSTVNKTKIKVVTKKVNKPIKKVVAKTSAAKKIVKPAKNKAIKSIEVKKSVDKKPVLKKVELKKPIVKEIPKKIEAKKVEAKKEFFKPAPIALKKEIPSAKEEKVAETISKKKDYNGTTDVLAITNTIPKKEKVEISLSKIASISSSITNPIKKTDSYAIKPEKEPNGKFELEFIIHASADMLYEFLSTPSGLSEWFCDDVNIRNGIYTFIWDGQMQQARLLKTVDVLLVRFQWVDKNDGSYFEFRIQRDDLTNDISLIITDFADTNAERESSKLLWGSQVEKLMHVIGSIF